MSCEIVYSNSVLVFRVIDTTSVELQLNICNESEKSIFFAPNCWGLLTLQMINIYVSVKTRHVLHYSPPHSEGMGGGVRYFLWDYDIYKTETTFTFHFQHIDVSLTLLCSSFGFYLI